MTSRHKREMPGCTPSLSIPISTITVTDAAKELEVRVDEVYRLIRSGRLAAKKINGKLIIDYDSLLKHIANRGNNGR